MNPPSRNDPCPCGSGLKYKKCCMAGQVAAATPARSAAALLRGAVQLHGAGRFAEAEAAYLDVLRAQPRHAEALHRLALLYHAQRRYAEAAFRLEAAVAVEGHDAAHHTDLAVMYDALGRDMDAIAAFRRALALRPDSPEALVNLGRLHFRRQEFGEAAACCRRALALRPDFPLALLNLGLASQQLGCEDEALACFERAVKLQPDLAEAHYNLGCALNAREDGDAAARHFRRALALKSNFVEAHYNLGRWHSRRNELEEAAASYRRALSLRPDMLQALLNLGLVYQHLGRHDDSVACYERALGLKPDFAEAHHNLGCVLDARGERDAAAESYRRALAVQPELPGPNLNLGVFYQFIGNHDEAARYFAEAQRLEPDSMVVQSSPLMAQLYTGAAAEDLLSAHRAWGHRFETPLLAQWPAHPNVREPMRRLKIGYVSPDLCRHSVAWFMEPVLAHHDRAAVEVFCYFTGARSDDVSERLAGLSGHWLACGSWTGEQLARRIMEDGIDVLVDLAGHTRGCRLDVFARKPAPVQVNWLGYPATSGLDAMDWRLCTLATDPPGEERWHTEKLYRLPRSLWCYRPRADQHTVAPRAPMLARGGEVRFGSTNYLAKVSSATIRVWSEILKAVPGSRLAMTGVPEGEARRFLAGRFAACGIAEDRLMLHGRLDDEAFGELLETIDIALDPFPYNGTTTTCETLWRGVPVVTVAGERSVARSGIALFGLLGLESLVARDPDEYVRLAVGLAKDPGRLGTLRGELRARFERSALRDEAGFTRELEQAYREMWKAWCTASVVAYQRARIPSISETGQA